MSVISTWGFSQSACDLCVERLTRHCDPIDDVVEAVVNAVELVEADPAVHSVGSFSYPNRSGFAQLDAAIIAVGDGVHKCGSVMALEGYRGAIAAARLVMDKCQHNILVGEGARHFLEEQGLPAMPRESVEVFTDVDGPAGDPSGFSHDTVGIVALSGHAMCVGCSTSGMRAKSPGRVGDSPLFGSGIYAQVDAGGAVCTGDGDLICTVPLAFTVVSLMKNQKRSPSDACREAIEEFLSMPHIPSNVEVAVIAMDFSGQVGAWCSPNLKKIFQFCTGGAGEFPTSSAVRFVD